jgi:hypothetical protein
MVLLGPILAAMEFAFCPLRTQAARLDPSETIIILRSAIRWTGWTGVPPHIAEMAALYGDLNKPGPYLVCMKWYPGYMSAPHQYATDRLSVVLSGTWWVNSGSDFEPENSVPVPAGGFVRRVAHTWHYDGVRKNAGELTVIAIFGIGPVNLKLADPYQPNWRRV